MRYLFCIVIPLVLVGCSEQKPPTKPSVASPVNAATPSVEKQSEPPPLKPIDDPDLNSDQVILSDIPAITLSSDLNPGTGQGNKVEELIASLSSIEDPDFGLSPTMTGTAFLPIEGKSNAGMLLLTDHNIRSSNALKQLVSLGPAALNGLLSHLDDKTPTKLKVDHGGGFGGMWFANELWGNPVSKKEQSILQARPRTEEDAFGGDHVESYTVKVGDICLVAIGQITGRGYQTVRYQPTACIVINSPTQDPTLCQQVRAMWQSDDPRSTLFESLLLDYSTRGKFNGDSLDGWSVGSSLQIEAAMRLLYYYPVDSAKLLVDRVDQLDVTRTGPPSDTAASESELYAFITREVANAVRTDDFIAAVSWSKDPDIVAALKRVAERTDDEDIIRLVSEAR